MYYEYVLCFSLYIFALSKFKVSVFSVHNKEQTVIQVLQNRITAKLPEASCRKNRWSIN